MIYNTTRKIRAIDSDSTIAYRTNSASERFRSGQFLVAHDAFQGGGDGITERDVFAVVTFGQHGPEQIGIGFVFRSAALGEDPNSVIGHGAEASVGAVVVRTGHQIENALTVQEMIFVAHGADLERAVFAVRLEIRCDSERSVKDFGCAFGHFFALVSQDDL